jgi:hypothetical protein
MISTFNEYHLGDQLIHLNWLRKVATANGERHFSHHCRPEHLEKIRPLVCDVPNISLSGIENRPAQAINCWINANGSWDVEPFRRNWVNFHIVHFRRLARQMGVESPIASREDLLFDYPALLEPNEYCRPFDILLINSAPRSGQFPGFSSGKFVELVRALVANGLSVITSEPTGLCASAVESNISITGIGSMSRHASVIISVNTGPMWTTFNVHNRSAYRIIYCNYYSYSLVDNLVVTANIDSTIDLLRLQFS